MARAKGFQGLVGRKKASVWGTAVAAGALDGIEVLSVLIDGSTQAIEDLQITGRVTQREATAGVRQVSVALATALRYEGNEFDVAMLMGTAGVPATVDTSARNHLLKIADQIDGIFGTIAYEIIKDTTVIEAPSVKWNSLTLRARQNERVQLELAGIADDFEPASAVNTTTTVDTITLPATREYADFSQCVLELNAQSGADFAGGDVLYVSGFEMTIERAMEGRVSTEHGDKVSEPIETGFAKVSGSLEFPQVGDGTGGNSAFLADQMTLARKKAKLTVTSPNLAGAAAQYYQHVLWLPNLQFGEGKPGIGGPEGPTWTLPFSAWHVDTIPTGFTAGYLDAVTWEVFNQNSADPLA